MNYIYDKKYPVTSILIILTTLVFVGMLILRGFSYAEAQTVFEFGAVYSPTIIMNPIQIWRLFSAIFVHIGLEHFVVNVITLYFIGRQAEDIFGSRNFFLLYMMSGLMGNIFVFFFSPDTARPATNAPVMSATPKQISATKDSSRQKTKVTMLWRRRFSLLDSRHFLKKK